MAQAELASYINSLDMVENFSDFRSSFKRRLELQKAVYLLQEAGAKLGYHFGWYIHGPYSSSLADDAYPLSSFGNLIKRFQEPVNEKALNKFRTLMEAVPDKDKRIYWLELLSSVHYVMKHSFPRAKNKREAVETIIKVKGKKFSLQEIGKAYDLLQSKSFI